MLNGYTVHARARQELIVDQWPQRAGDIVDILGGAFAGLTGVFQSVTAADRATLLIELLGRYNEVEVTMNFIGLAK